MSWNFRVIRYTKNNMPFYRIAEVYYDKDGKPRGYTTETYNPVLDVGEMETLAFFAEKVSGAIAKPLLLEVDGGGLVEEKSAVAVIIKRDNKVLAIQRKDGTLGLPCGKLEEGENLVEAGKRECLEEAGLEIEISSLDYFNAKDNDYRVYTFLASSASEAVGWDKLDEGGLPRWVDPWELVASSRFGAYNQKALEHFNIIED